MPRKDRLLKTQARNIRDLDDTLFIVRRQLLGLQDDSAYFKVLTAALRTLVCYSSQTEGLLWRVVDDLGVSDEIQVQGNIGKYNLDSRQAHGLRLATTPLFRVGEGPPQYPIVVISLRALIKDTEATFFAGRGFTWEQTIRKLCEQMGLSHESEDVEHLLVNLDTFGFAMKALRVALINLTDFILEVGERVLAHAESHTGFTRTRRRGCGEFCVFTILEVVQQAAGRIPIFRMQCPIVASEIVCTVSPARVNYAVQRGIHAIGEFSVPFPKSGLQAVYTFSYSSNARTSTLCMTDLRGEFNVEADVDCNLGWVEASEVRPPQLCDIPNELVICHGIGLHQNRLTPSDVQSLIKLPAVLIA